MKRVTWLVERVMRASLQAKAGSGKAMSDPFNVLFIGAGEINFGSPEGPWNHSLRLETLLGDRLNVLAIVDPDVERCDGRILSKRRDLKAAKSWSHTRSFATVQSASKALGNPHISLIVNGCPPHFRGTLLPGKDMDMQLLAAFDNVGAILVEKPVAAADPLTTDCHAVAQAYEKRNTTIVAVGYMLRYLKTVQKLKTILQENKLVPMAINARYLMAYEYASKQSWWDKDQSCGPVVEQATHFVDLIRYLAGSEVVKSSVTAATVEHDEAAGRLSKLAFDEETLIEPKKRVPRITMATWKHQRGTLSSLCHGIALHGNQYSTEIDIVADGWLLRLSDVYSTSPRLSITKPGQTSAEVISVDDDPFASEFETIIDASDHRTGSKGDVLSTYEDALQTYVLTWLIRRAGEVARH